MIDEATSGGDTIKLNTLYLPTIQPQEISDFDFQLNCNNGYVKKVRSHDSRR